MRHGGYTDSSPQASHAAVRVAVSANSLEFPEPGVGNDSSQHRREIAEAAEGMVDGSREVLVPFQVGEEVKGQHRWELDM